MNRLLSQGLVPISVLAASLVLAAAPTVAAPQPPARRNVLLLIGDDHGLQLGCYGDRTIHTPYLDRLAMHGVQFSHAFAAVSSCSPSRSVILTGLFNHQNGQYGLAHAEHNQHTLERVQSLPLVLGKNGYRTGIIGKVHVQPRSVYPFEQEVATGLEGNRGIAAIADRAAAFFKADPRPFFLVVGFGDPHRAAQGFGNAERYRGWEPVAFKPGSVPLPAFMADQPEARRDLADYYQAINRLDQGVGLVFKALDDSGQAGETLVIYVSDNGMPFAGAKTSLYDAGIHLPLLIHTPSQSRRGLVNNAMVSWVDLAPTVLDWARVAPPAGLAGRSILPILERETVDGWDEIYASHTFHEITMYYPMRAVRTRHYKLIWNLAHPLEYPLASDLWGSPTWQDILHRRDPMLGRRALSTFLHRPEFELYDLQSDPDELHNVASDPSFTPVLGELKAKLLAKMKATSDPWLEPIMRSRIELAK
jgi:N-sulfoglucosamine sulfohydrolase